MPMEKISVKRQKKSEIIVTNVLEPHVNDEFSKDFSETACVTAIADASIEYV
jgi:hypothetical protein